MARKQPVVVMNRDQPEAVLFHLDDDLLQAIQAELGEE